DLGRAVPHERDVAGFCGRLLDDPNRVHQHLRALALARRELGDHPSIADPTLVTPEAEFLFKHQRWDEAIHLIRERYVPLYRLYPNQYTYQKIMDWCAEHGFEVTVPEPEHTTAVLSFVPRYSFQSV